jgi:GT2 family glycosyltransferase
MISAVIPTLYHPPQLAMLLAVLEHDEVEVHLLESGIYEHRIYRMWNEGVRRAKGDYIAVLNDDIKILPGTLPLMARILEAKPKLGVVYPDQWAPLEAGLPEKIQIQLTEGSARVGGMAGFCFMFRRGLMLPFDERFNWWFGDDQFEFDVRAEGLQVGRVNGLPLSHDQSTSAERRKDELGPLIQADQRLWRQEHG